MVQWILELNRIFIWKDLTYIYVSIIISSSMFQSSYEWSGKYRRIIIGIFRCFSSFIAICRGSVSPSNSTIIGAHIAIWRARVPSTLARSYLIKKKFYITFFVKPGQSLCLSYLVIYFVVILLFLATLPPVWPAGMISNATSSSWSSMLSSSASSSKSSPPPTLKFKINN